MGWSDHVFLYCERGLDAGFWAEPLNALSNLSFIAAGAAALGMIWRRGSTRRNQAHVALSVLVLMIGVGSFLFHTFATRWAALADTLPIGVFMLTYTAYATRQLAGLSWGVSVGAALALALCMVGSSLIPCASALCRGGQMAYLPALLALVMMTLALLIRAPAAALSLGLASSLFAISLVLRSQDTPLCELSRSWLGSGVGTHALWHVLNGALLFVLLRVAIVHGRFWAKAA